MAGDVFLDEILEFYEDQAHRDFGEKLEGSPLTQVRFRRIVEKHKGGISVVTVVRAVAADGGELMN